MQVNIGLGFRTDLVGGKAIVGRGPWRVREWHVERDRLRNELVVRGDSGTEGGRLL